MQEQIKFKYIYNGKEVSKEVFQDLAGDNFKWFKGNSVISVGLDSFNNFFDGNFKSEKQINNHVKSILNMFEECKNQGIKDFESVYNTKSIDERIQLSEFYKKQALESYNICKKNCSPQCFCDGSCKKENNLHNSTRHKSQSGETHKAIEGVKETQIAYKETEGKLFYELDWGFITQMAERMASNKKEDKYELFNWKKPMTPKGVEDLKQATVRHLLEVLEGRYEDDGRKFGHLEAISDNMMMINYQLKLNKS